MKLVIDHINDIKTDNRLDNLQIVTNRFNCNKTQGRYSSSFEGVYWNKTIGKWTAGIRINGKQKYLGNFVCEQTASNAYQKALNDIEN